MKPDLKKWATPGALLAAAMCAVVFLWSTPFLWMLIASFRPDPGGGLGMASLVPDFVPTLQSYRYAIEDGYWPLWFLNSTILVTGTLVVQLVTISLAGYAFARITFPGKEAIFYIFLLQLMLAPPVLIVPNLTTLVHLGLYDSLIGVMAPYWGSAFGTFLMRQTFRTIPKDFEEAAIIDGASWWQVLRHVLIPLSLPGLTAFSIVSVVYHWNEFLWPLMVINDPDKMVLTVGLVSFAQGAEGASDWGLIAAGTLFIMAPLFIAFTAFQRQFVNSFMSSGVK
ncbi:carbohydrate ABC transporter permease [Nisaea denitrificans]|uniref:carbohydrate ABC transporter permease n=1 Tax=Nisaea denitrificans TaxID=390877 RepID=UPI00040B715D|nr:carbohydrate ABC transporter permease [Nisaea denitrificans]